MQHADLINNLPKLRWACRRGMLELDVLLGNFLQEAYQAQPPQDKVLFCELLQCTDQELFRWLLGAEAAPTDLERIITLVRNHARHRLRS